MKSITKWSFRNKAAMIVIVVLVLAVGGLSYFTLPMEFLPEADNPQITIATLGQGYDASSMEQAVTGEIEKAVAAVKGKRNVFSTTGDGYSQVTINFEPNTAMKEATQEVHEALSSLVLPDGISKPHVVQLNTSMIPVSQISIAFDDGLTEENIERVEKDIFPQFQNLPGVANTAIYGKPDPRVVIHLDQDKMAEKHVPLQSVTSLLEGQNFAVSVGEQTINRKSSNIKVAGDLNGLDSLKNMVIPNAVPDAPVVHLQDIADVKRETNKQSVTRVNGEEALVVTVTKDSTSSAVTVADEVAKTIEKINADFDGVHIKNIYSSADMIKGSVNGMLREVLLGALFATMVILLFLRNIRATAITIVSIPLSLGLTLFLLWMSGVTLNILTLGGVAVSIGRLVDDSIVVVENIFRRKQVGQLTKASIVDATAEVGKAITSSTLATVAVFLPMGLIEGSLRSFLLPFGLTVTYSLLASLIVAVTVVPLMSTQLFKSKKLIKHDTPKRYLKVLTWSLNHKVIPILTAIVVFAASIVLYAVMPKGALSADDASMVNVTMAYSNDTPPEEVKEHALKLESHILDLDGYSDVYMELGNSDDSAQWGEVGSANRAAFSIIMQENADTNAFIDAVNREKEHFPEADISVATSSLMSMSTSEITYDLIGDDLEKLEAASETITAAVKGLDGVEKVSSNQEEKKPVYNVSIDTSKANAQQTAMQLRMLLNEIPIGSVKLDERETQVRLNANMSASSEKDLDELPLATPEGIVPLSSVAKIERNELSSTLLHKDGDPYVRVSVDVEPEKLSVVSQELAAAIDKVELPAGVQLETGGASSQQADDFADLGLTMLASIGIVYLIMVITFKSLRAPIAILMTIPLASIGAVLGLLILDVPVDPTVLIGALMLIGIVVTNAIVMIDKIKQNEEAMPIREAIVEGACTRLRPILMTALATICAMLPLLFGHTEDGSIVSQGLAIVVIGGLAVSTILTLVIVPVFYELLHFRQVKKQRNAKKSA